MKFKYSLPPEDRNNLTDGRFLPSLALTVFSSENPDDKDEPQSTVFLRRAPQLIKMKLDLINRLRTGLVMPVGKTADGNFFLKMKSEEFWKNRAFLPDPMDFDFAAGGRYDESSDSWRFQVYSVIDDILVYDGTYSATGGQKLQSINKAVFDLLEALEISPSPKEKEKIQNRPVRNEQGLTAFMEALDLDPVNGVYSEGKDMFTARLKDVLTLDPESDDVSEILVLQARQLYRRQDYNGALSLLEFILSFRPRDEGANTLLTLILIQQEQLEKAEAGLRDLHERGFSTGIIPYRVAKELMETHMTEPAVRMFELAVSFDCREPDLYDSFSHLLLSLGRLEEALQILMQGLDIYPGRLHALITAAQLLSELKKTAEAAIAYETAEALHPDSAILHISMALHLAMNKHTDGARKKINRALELSPEDPLVNLEAARILDFIDMKDEAQRYARTAVELSPGSRTAVEAQELLSRIAGNLTKEEQWSNREKYLQARKLFEEGKPLETIAVLEEVTKREPLFWKGWFLLGMAYRRIEDFPRALRAFGQVDDLYPDQVALHHEIGRCLMGMERFREAYPHMLSAFRRHPHDPVIMANMALLYLFSGNPEEAERLLLQAQRMTGEGGLKLDPYIKEARRLKERKNSGRGNGSIVPLGDTHGEGAGEPMPEDDGKPLNPPPEPED